MIDQHAADERASIEQILKDLCLGFLDDDVEQTELKSKIMMILTRGEMELLSQPGHMDIINRWGIELGLPSDPARLTVEQTEEACKNKEATGDGSKDYVQVGIRAVPTSLESRLGSKDAVEMTRLMKLYLPFLEGSFGEIRAMLDSAGTATGEAKLPQERERRQRGIGMDGERNEHQRNVDWRRVSRFMPKEMLELCNSKACRSECTRVPSQV